MSQFLFQPATVVVDSVPEYIAWKVWTPDQSLTLPTKHQILRLTAGDGYSITEFRWEDNPVRNAKQWLFTEKDGRPSKFAKHFRGMLYPLDSPRTRCQRNSYGRKRGHHS